MSKSVSEKLTNAITKWIALDCNSIAMVEDKDL